MATSSPKILVVYFSRAGTTRRVAEAIAHASGAVLEELREKRSRRGPLGWLRSGYEATYRRAAKPLPLAHDPAQYDIVVVGTPTWNRAVSSPIRGFLEQYRDALRDVALFATCQGRGADVAIAQMTGLLRRPPLARLALLESDVKHGAAVRLGEFVESTLVAWEGHQAQRLSGDTAQRCASA